MIVYREGDRMPHGGDTFSGVARLERVHPQRDGGIGVAVVSFEDGARTHWHTHPGEQLLYIIEGEGRVGNEHEEVEVSAGDVVYTAPGERHWHGAKVGHSMSHISITNVGAPEWHEAVEG